MLGNPRAELAGVVNAIGKARVTHERCERERRNVLKRHVFDSHSRACKAAAVVADGSARIGYVVPLRVGLKPYRHAVTLGNRPIDHDCKAVFLSRRVALFARFSERARVALDMADDEPAAEEH